MNHLEYFKRAISDKGNCNATETVETLIKCGLLNEKHILNYVIRDQYYKRLKENKTNCFNIKLDLAVEYDVPETTIHNIIYRETHIKV